MFTAARISEIASRRCSSDSPLRRRTWISAPSRPGKRAAKRAFGVPAGWRESNTSRAMNLGSSSLGTEVSP